MAWRKFLRRKQWDSDRSREIESYIQIETDDNIARGLSPAAARAAARKKFGNPTQVREEIYQMNTVGVLDTMAREVRYALRGLRLNPSFTIIALLTLAIGIGANTAVFSVVNAVLLRPLPYPRSEEVVSLHQAAPGAAGLASVSDGLHLSGSMYFTFAEQNQTLTNLGIWSVRSMAVTGESDPEQVPAAIVSDGILQSLNVRPLMGRWLTAEDQKPGTPEALVLSYGFWQRHFGGDKSVIGRGIKVESRPMEIVGVMPRQFRLADEEADIIVPLRLVRSQQRAPGFAFQGIARLKAGVTIQQANADLARLIPIWMNSWPSGGDVFLSWKITPDLRPLKDEVIGNIGSVLWIVMGTIGIVMLIACANVANLLLIRAEGRQHELAVRAALGAGRARIVRELLLESLMLGLLGGVLGLGLAHAAVQLLAAIGPANLPRLAEISIDPAALAFALAVSLVSGLLFGLMPALKYAGPRIPLALRAVGRSMTHSRQRHRARNILVVGQVALALVLLVSSGLMIRSFQALRNVEPGFVDPQQVQALEISIPNSLVPEADSVAALQRNLVERLAAIPGVDSVAFASSLPMEDNSPNWDAILKEGETISATEAIPPLRVFKNVSPGLFTTLGTKRVVGRDYTWTDLEQRRTVVMISENLARELWGSPSAAIGKRLRAPVLGPLHEVIGVVQDVHDGGVDEPSPPIVYWPASGENYYQAALKQRRITRTVTFAIRSSRAGTESFVVDLHRAVAQINANLPLAQVMTLQTMYDESMARTSFTLIMLAIAGSMALILGIIGIYGVIAYAVSQRNREIGIRLALGAQPSELQSMFVRHGLLLALTGLAIGLGAAAGLARLMSSLLFGISPLDPMTYGAGALILASAAALASYLPARRASAVDPVVALRAE
jgi:predicted permease